MNLQHVKHIACFVSAICISFCCHANSLNAHYNLNVRNLKLENAPRRYCAANLDFRYDLRIKYDVFKFPLFCGSPNGEINRTIAFVVNSSFGDQTDIKQRLNDYYIYTGAGADRINVSDPNYYQTDTNYPFLKSINFSDIFENTYTFVSKAKNINGNSNLKYTLSADITLTMKSLEINYTNEFDTKIEKVLPYEDDITIEISRFFPESVYRKIRLVYANNADFHSARYYCNMSDVIDVSNPYYNISGKDLYPNIDDFKQLSNVYVKAEYTDRFGNTTYSDPITLIPMLSAPSLDFYTFVPQCSGDYGTIMASLIYPPLETFEIGLVLTEVSPDSNEQRKEVNILSPLKYSHDFDVLPGSFNMVETRGVWYDKNGNKHDYFCDAPRHKAVLTMPKAPEPVTVNLNGTSNVRCNGGSDGSVCFTTSGGTGEKSVRLYRNGTDEPLQMGKNVEFFQGLASGSYHLIATDKNGCKSESVPLTITEPNVLAFDMSHEDATIYDKADGKINITELHGGTPPYTVRLTNTATAETGSFQIDNPTEDLVCVSSTVKAGRYSVFTSDRNNCTTDSKPVTILQPDKLVIESIEETKHILCSGDRGFDGAEVAAAVTGGVGSYTYTWKGDDGQGDGTSATDHTRAQLAAGNYTLYVKDRNGAIAQRNFTVQEPAPLKTDIQTTDIKCMGSKNGTLQAGVSGGTAPYTYRWENSDGKPISAVSAINNLAEGTYTFHVKDANGCKANTTAKINVLSDITVEETLKRDVSCYGLSDGEVSYMISGGVTPYTVKWQNETYVTECAVDKKNIKAGVYDMTVTDNIGCSQRLNVLIDQPDKIGIDVPESVKLCKGQTRVITPGSADSRLTFRWYKDGETFSSEPEAVIERQGVYKITASDGRCSDSAFVHVSESDDLINCDWLVASKAPAGSAVRLVNITRENAERWSWVFDASPDVTLADEGERFADLVFNQTGTYTVGLRTFNNGCEMTSMKSVEIVEDGADIGDYLETAPLITRFDVSPNPSDGNIVISLELSQTEKALIDFYDIVNGRRVAPQIVLEGHKSYRKEASLNLSAGVYYLAATFEGSRLRQTFKLIIR